MQGRILDVTADTTLDFVDGSARGLGWRDEGAAVLDVTPDGDDPDRVTLSVELDPGAVEHVDPHADSVSLTGEQARRLASALEAAVEADPNRSARSRG
jgi:hypothetical protein